MVDAPGRSPGHRNRADLAALPIRSYLRATLGEGDERQPVDRPPLGRPVLTFLQRDFAAGWRGEA
jgi:hypothetical protein